MDGFIGRFRFLDIKPCRLVQTNVSDESVMSIFRIKCKYPIPYRLCIDNGFIFTYLTFRGETGRSYHVLR